MVHSLTLIKARLKLQKSHLWEWDTLTTTQRKVWNLVREEATEKLFLHVNDRQATAELKCTLARRLIKIMTQQREERQRMSARHQEEAAKLEMCLKAPEKIQTETLPGF